MEELSRVERAVINAFQGGFPVIEEPFEPAASALTDAGIEVDADQLRSIVADLDDRGVLSRFGPLINAQEIGGSATLVAMGVPDEDLEASIEAINRHPEVAHNYERTHPTLNLWFVVSVVDESRIDAVLESIEAETGYPTYNMPKRREFHVEAIFPLDGPLADGLDLSDRNVEPIDVASPTGGLTPRERDLVLAIQDGLPITRRPYAAVAESIDEDVAWVLGTISRFLKEEKIRRIGVIPNHYALGYSENAMTVWNVPDEHVEAVGSAVAALPFVTHCYERPRHGEVWPYNFFAMTHGRNASESDDRIARVEEVMERHWSVTEDDWTVLYSTRILKKTGLRIEERIEASTGG